MDGNYEDNMNLLLEEFTDIYKAPGQSAPIGSSTAERAKQSTPSSDYNFKKLKHFVLVGEGLPDDSWMTHKEEVSTGIKSLLRSKVLDLKKCLNHMPKVQVYTHQGSSWNWQVLSCPSHYSRIYEG